MKLPSDKQRDREITTRHWITTWPRNYHETNNVTEK